MHLKKSDIEQIASLARLELTEEEVGNLTGHINQIMDYFAELQQLNTENVEPTSHVIPIENVFREDKSRPSLTPDEVTANAPEKHDGKFVVPRIVET